MMLGSSILFYAKGLCLLISNALRTVLGGVMEVGYEKMADIPEGTVENWEEVSWLDFAGRQGGRILAVLFFVLVYYLGFSPLNRVKMLTDIGWGNLDESGKRTKDIVSRVREIQRVRKVGDIPPVYPNGWFSVAESRFIGKNEVKSVQCLGETLAVFRGESGEISVLDAYCPHMGANMAVGGIVKGDCLECPFHGWIFSGQNGSCTQIPYAKKVPDFTKVRRWTSDERNGHIYVWYDAEDRPPSWSVPTFEEIEKGTYIYRGRTEHHITAHIQEIPENGADIAHLCHLHVPNILKGADLTKAFTKNQFLDLIHHEWTGAWEPQDAPERHVAEVSLRHAFSVYGGKFKVLDAKITAKQVGPGLVFLIMETCFGNGILVQTLTPQEPLRQKLVHQFYTSSSLIAPIAKLIILAEAHHVERDIMIWNNKTFLSRPLLLAEDKLIVKFRRWYSQFYSENSPKFEGFRKENSFDW